MAQVASLRTDYRVLTLNGRKDAEMKIYGVCCQSHITVASIVLQDVTSNLKKSKVEVYKRIPS